MTELSFAQKISIVNTIKNEIISFPAYRYRKLRDLLTFCEDNNIDVVLKAVAALCKVFCDIIPSYRIREIGDKPEEKSQEQDGKGKGAAGYKAIKISKEVEALQT